MNVIAGKVCIVAALSVVAVAAMYLGYSFVVGVMVIFIFLILAAEGTEV